METFYVIRKHHIQTYRLSKLNSEMNQDLNGLDLSNKWKKNPQKFLSKYLQTDSHYLHQS